MCVVIHTHSSMVRVLHSQLICDSDSLQVIIVDLQERNTIKTTTYEVTGFAAFLVDQ